MYIYQKSIFFNLIALFCVTCYGTKFDLLNPQENIQLNNTKDNNMTVIPLENFKIIKTSNVSVINNSTNETVLQKENYSDPTDFKLEAIFKIKRRKYKYQVNINLLNLYDKNQTKRLEINLQRNNNSNVKLIIKDLAQKNHTELISVPFVVSRNKWTKLTISFKENSTITCLIDCNSYNASNNDSVGYSAFPIGFASGKLFTNAIWKLNIIKFKSFELQSDNDLNKTVEGNCTDVKNMNKRGCCGFDNAISTKFVFNPVRFFDFNTIEYNPFDEFEKLLASATGEVKQETAPIVWYEWNLSLAQ